MLGRGTFTPDGGATAGYRVEQSLGARLHRQWVGQCRPWAFGPGQAAMRRSPAAHPLVAVNDRFSLQATAGPDPHEKLVVQVFDRQIPVPSRHGERSLSESSSASVAGHSLSRTAFSRAKARQLAYSGFLGRPVLRGPDVEPIGEQFQAYLVVGARYKKRLQR